MNNLIILTLTLVGLVLLAAPFCFSIITTGGVSATVNGVVYVSIPEAVRAVFSKEIIRAAIPVYRFMQFAKIKRDLTVSPGKNITFTKFNALSGGGQLLESDSMPEVGLGTSEVAITVVEWGNGVKVQELALRTSMFDILAEAANALSTNAAATIDKALRDAVLSTTYVKYGGGKTTAADITAADGLDSQTIKNCVELLATNDAPKFGGQYYVCFAHPHQLRQLRDDPEWRDAHKYIGSRALYLGEEGMYEGVIFISTTNMPILSQAAVNTKYGAGYTLTSGYEAVVFGQQAYGWAIAADIELRDNGIEDYGRKRGLAWYMIAGAGLLEAKYSVRVLTS